MIRRHGRLRPSISLLLPFLFCWPLSMAVLRAEEGPLTSGDSIARAGLRARLYPEERAAEAKRVADSIAKLAEEDRTKLVTV